MTKAHTIIKKLYVNLKNCYLYELHFDLFFSFFLFFFHYLNRSRQKWNEYHVTLEPLPDIVHAGRRVSALLPRLFISQSDPWIRDAGCPALSGPSDSAVVNHRKWQRLSPILPAVSPTGLSSQLWVDGGHQSGNIFRCLSLVPGLTPIRWDCERHAGTGHIITWWSHTCLCWPE